MKIRNPNSGKGRKESTEESSDEGGSGNDDNSNLTVYDDDSEETVSCKVVDSESEEVDSDDYGLNSPVILSKRKHNHPIESVSNSKSEDESSSDDGNNSPMLLKKRKRNHPIESMSNSKSEDESSSNDSSDSQMKVKKRKINRPKELMSNSSDSGDETCEKCAICLRSILNQEVGSPEGCDHLFCSVCITEWSKNSNVCPLDRQKFSIILVRKNKTGNVVRQLSVEEPKSCFVFNEDGDNTYCEICGESDREDRMLLCDGCQRGFHLECLTPPLEEVPAEEEWFCPTCSVVFSVRTRNEVLQDLEELNDIVRHRRIRSTRRRNGARTRIRTRLMERIRIAVNRIVRSCFLDSDQDENDDDDDNDFEINDSESESSFSDEPVSTESRPGTSGTQRRTRSTSSKKKTIKGRKRRTKNSTSKRKAKRTSKRKKTAGSKRKTKSKSNTTSKRLKFTDSDGNVKSIKTRSYKKRRKHKVKKKVKTAASLRNTSRASATPKTVKGRLAVTLGIVPATKPGQLLPDVRVRSSRNELSGIDINRARAGIPRLHIFEPRHELQLYSSGSDGEGYAEGEGSSLATFAQPRMSVSSMRDRKRAAILLQSAQPASVRPRPIVQQPAEEVDILDSILRSQTIWHSKNTDVKIKEDGSVEVSLEPDKKNQGESSKGVDGKGTASEATTTQAPMYPGSSSRPGGFRPYNRASFGDSRGTQDSSVSGRGSSSQTGMGFSRFGSASRNDREGYANYLNNMPQGPTPFCRGGPPLRFRMPSRQQLRRIPFPPRTNRSPWHNEEEDETESGNKDKDESGNRAAEDKKTDEEDIDLYSDIESNAEKAESSEQDESSSTSYPALGPPPEPSAFLLGIDENGEVTREKNNSEAYDPAEPCDSEDEMVIDVDEQMENVQSPGEREKEAEQAPPASNLISRSVSHSENTSPNQTCQRDSSEEGDNDCPISTTYSSENKEFPQKKEERKSEIAEEKRKFEKVESHDEKTDGTWNQKEDLIKPEEEKFKGREPEETTVDNGIKTNDTISDEDINDSVKNQRNTLSFDIEMGDDKCQSQDDEDSNSNSHSDGTDRPGRYETSIVDLENSPGSESGRSPLLRSSSVDSEKSKTAKTPSSRREKSSSVEILMADASRGNSKGCDSDSEAESKKRLRLSDEEENEKRVISRKKPEKTAESQRESAQTKFATGLEGLDVEEVSSDNEDDEFMERSLSSLSLSDLSNRSHDSPSRRRKRRKKRRKSLRKTGKKYEDNDDMLKEKKKDDKDDLKEVINEDIENEEQGERYKKRKSKSVECIRQVLGNKDNKKDKSKEKEKDLSWKKPSKKDKNYREGKKRSKERGRSKSKERRKSKSPSPKKDKRKSKDRRKKSEKKKDIERYDVRKIVKNKEIRKTDAFGRDILSKSRSISRSRSRSPIRDRSRNMLRRDSRSYSRSPSRGYRRGRSPIRRRYKRSRTKSRSKSLRRSFSRSRSHSRSARKNKKKFKSKDRLRGRSRSRGKKSRSRRRSPTRSRSRTPMSRVARGKRPRPRRSWSHNSRSLSFSPRRSRSVSRTPPRIRRSYTRSASSSWSRGRSPIPRGGSLEKLTVVLKTKDKKKGKKKKDGKRYKRDEDRRRQSGNSKEVFASGDNVLVSVNFGNNNNTASNSNNSSASNEINRNKRLDSMSPAPSSDRKKKKGSDYEMEKAAKKAKKSNTISKNVVDTALSTSASKRAKKLTRLSEKDAEVILNRKPVAVIDLDMSPYREQTPSPINVVVVSDSGSGDEGKEPTPQGENGSPSSEPEKNPESADAQSTNVSIPSSPVTNGYLTGPKTPPEPQIKFSIAKPQQLRPIANPLGDDDDDEEEEEEEEEEEDAEEAEDQEFKRIESLDRRIEKELDGSHKGPNTPPEPRGPTTPQTSPSPQTSPDAYDPFEPTKSRSPTPTPEDKEIRQSPSAEKNDEQPATCSSETLISAPTCAVLGEIEKDTSDSVAENPEDQSPDMAEKCDVENLPESSVITPSAGQQSCPPTAEIGKEDSPEKKISLVLTTPQNKVQSQSATQKPFTLALKPLCLTPATSTSSAAIPSSLSMPFSSFSHPSPTKTRSALASQPIQVSGIQRLQHRLGSPVNRTPNSVKSTPEKRSTPRTDANDAGNYRTASKRNGEQAKQVRPLQDDTIDMTAEMDDSPYSPASSEGDDLFDPPMEPTKPVQSNVKTIQPGYKPPPAKAPHKSPIKQLSKFDLLFGPTGPSLSPVRVGSKKPKPGPKLSIQPKTPTQKTMKKNSNKRGVSLKMDEDQLRILDELPSSAVELQVKDKFLKKLNRQERVVDEVKTVLKPHYARKHITKEEYKDILRRSVPKICHSRSGEINPSKIQSLIEAYVRKFRHAKKKGSSNAVLKTKVK